MAKGSQRKRQLRIVIREFAAAPSRRKGPKVHSVLARLKGRPGLLSVMGGKRTLAKPDRPTVFGRSRTVCFQTAFREKQTDPRWLISFITS